MIGLVVTMSVFAIIGAALVTITSTSTLSQVAANSSRKAYYLAESGYRYATSQFLNAGTTENARDEMLATLHDKTFTVSNAGSFRLLSYPYFYKVTGAHSTGATTLVTRINGGFPSGRVIPASGRVQVFVNASPVSGPYNYSSFSRSGSNVTFNLSTGLSNNVAADSTVLPVVPSSGTAQTLSRNGSLALSSTSAAEAFPLYNGTFSIGSDTQVYSYSSRSGTTLSGIKKYWSPADTFSVSVGAGTDIVLRKYLELSASGSVGGGIFATSRAVAYRGPVAAVAEDQGGATTSTPVTIVLSDLATASAGGSTGQFATVSLGGDEALGISQTTGGSGGGNPSSVEAYVTQSGSNVLYQAWVNAGNFLSYDAQVKVGTGTWSGGAFTSKPSTYCAGLTIRADILSNQSTFYGVSFMRSHTGSGHAKDGINDAMVPTPTSTYNDQPMIILWTRNGSQGGGDDNWLAFGTVSSANYVVNGSGLLTDWSSLLVRVVEAASIKLAAATAPLVNTGDTITGGSGTAKVVKKINDSDGNVVLLLNNVTAGFSRPAAVQTYNTDAAWGYRTRDNYLWVFYADPSAHGTVDTSPLNNNRLSEARSSTIQWPVADMADWSASEDKFTLVQWNASLNTGSDGDSTLRRMGTGNELNAILRTNRWGSASFTSSIPELGVVSLGDYSVNTYFDDFAYKLLFAAGGGGGTGATGTGYLAPLQQ
jgi:hypothetical protein